MRLLPGQIIAGTRYRVLAKVGQGAMGIVYAAEHVDLEKKVALKLLAGRVAENPEAVERFRQEARAASRIGSPYICDVTDFGELPDGRSFFVMEFLDGHSLRTSLDAHGRLTPTRIIGILRQSAKALGAAHDKRIIHLDVKPDNVMLLEGARRADTVKVVDFGIAGLIDQGRGDQNEEVVNGTPAYMAPERALGLGYDHRSDIYSLGVTAYEMITGTVPFDSEDVTTTLRRHVKEIPEPPSRRTPDSSVSPQIEAVVMKLLEKNPADRPQSMAEVEGLLLEAQISAGLQTGWDDLELPGVDDEWRASLAERMPSPHSRRARLFVGGAGAVAAVAVASAVYFGVFKKNVVMVPVEVTRTQESEAVAALLEQASKAAKALRYVPPPEDSALVYITKAEKEAAGVGVESPGARSLRRQFANTLAGVGNDLRKAGLTDLAIAKYKEALEFEPNDSELQRGAELTTEERRQLVERARRPSAERPAARKVSAEDQVKAVGTSLYFAAQSGRISAARASLKTLLQDDTTGVQVARLADAIRPLARTALAAGRTDDARNLYALLTQLDPADPEARERSKLPPAPAPPPDAERAEAPRPPPAVAAKPKRLEAEQPEPLPEPPRDLAAGRAAAAVGVDALGKGRLDEAEAGFRRAVRADPLNAVAIGGMAEVYFERARYPEALDWARKAMKLAPKSAKFLTIIGDSYFKLLRYKEARDTYQRALALVPDDSRLKGRMERVHDKLGR